MKYIEENGIKELVRRMFFWTKKTWIGTAAEWAALTDVQKNRYDIAHITDDAGLGVEVVDTVEHDNMNPVTSNAVFHAFDMMRPVNVSSYSIENITINAGTTEIEAPVLARQYGIKFVQVNVKNAQSAMRIRFRNTDYNWTQNFNIGNGKNVSDNLTHTYGFWIFAPYGVNLIDVQNVPSSISNCTISLYFTNYAFDVENI